MEHPCHQCGRSVEEGKPFCAQCGAPQIRVILPEPMVPAVAANIPANVPANDLPAFSLDPPVVRPPLNVSGLSTAVDWPHALRTSAIAALISALVMSLGLMVPLLAALGAGFLSVSLYRRRSSPWAVTARSGAQIGALCGLLFFGIASVFETIAIAVFHTGGQLRQKMLEALQQAAARSSDPQVQAAFDRLKTPEGLAVMLVLGLIVLFVISIVASSLAGALTGAVFGRRNRP
jgi:hypothetical protein